MPLKSRAPLALAAGVNIRPGITLTHGVLAETTAAVVIADKPQLPALQDVLAIAEIRKRVKTDYVGPGKDETVLDMRRDVISVASVKSKMLTPGYGYVRVSQFAVNTGKLLGEEINKLKKEAKGDLRGLVLDLRNNPGGVLNAAVEVSDVFLEK